MNCPECGLVLVWMYRDVYFCNKCLVAFIAHRYFSVLADISIKAP